MIMRDVNNGWLIRYLHSNTASAFFFIVYLHIGRGMYYGSYRAPRTLVWTIGTVIFILMMATAFLGYVLPYGQMSLWGATVSILVRLWIVILLLIYSNYLKLSFNFKSILFITIKIIIIIFLCLLDINISSLIHFIVPFDLSLFEAIQCDSPKAWKKYFCCTGQGSEINKDSIRIIKLDAASNGFTRSPVVQRDISDSTLASVAISMVSRIVPFIFRS